MRTLPSATQVRTVLALALTVTGSACGLSTWPSTLHPPDEPVPADDGTFLKVHTTAGALYVLSSWSVPEARQVLNGTGAHYDMDRELLGTGDYAIPHSEIALLETNRKEVVSRFAVSGLVAFSTLAGAVTLRCLADPKSCFGSCPTFYSTEDSQRPLAEGFSSSFARVLEERDLDQLGLRADSGPFSLVMRNEAQETHAVRHVRLVAVPVADTEEILHTADGTLYSAGGTREAEACASAEGDCRALVAARDDREYTSLTDSLDLGAREEVVLRFGEVSGDVGLVLSARNSLVTTFVFYQSLAYAGGRAGDLLAALERGEPGMEERVLGIARELGGIEVLVSEDGAPWRTVGEFGEAGPIASDQQLVPLGSVQVEDLRVMLRMAKGSWRVDEARLASVHGVVEARPILPDSVTSRRSADPVAHARLMDSERHLVTVPGDAYQLWFTIPEGGEHRLLLDTQGYYYEWTREAWLPDESAGSAAQVMLRPRDALRAMAPGFKKVESEMEDLFWSSRFRRNER